LLPEAQNSKTKSAKENRCILSLIALALLAFCSGRPRFLWSIRGRGFPVWSEATHAVENLPREVENINLLLVYLRSGLKLGAEKSAS
jgi:hypothetical protein